MVLKSPNARKLIYAFAFTLSTLTGHATVIIGGDILNGNLNAGSADGDTTDDNFQSTPDWVNVGGAATMQATRTNLPSPDSSRNAVLSLSGDRVFGSELGLNGYIISAGDTFDVQYEWRDAFNWNDSLDNVAITLFTTDDDTITGAATPLVVDLSGLSTANNTYETVNHDGIYTSTTNDAGKKLFLSFQGQPGEGSDTNGFARFDNLTLEVTQAIPEPSSALLICLAGISLMGRRR
ncbi:PEP-CTERM sorting domain-containing protein [Akkermansiaceae bacterium]|nr:PEP-CTERM sorting domain-containing protein [Akkermansiaceae bacterium]|tara:strand:+ start:559 stop:1266 length:708 start_codon:yes stop_codon:yes gene_type:complete